MYIPKDNNITNIFDTHFTLQCPHCNAISNVTAISIPRYELIQRFKLNKVGIVYKCDSCNEPIFLKFHIDVSSLNKNPIKIYDDYIEIERPQESFDFKYLPEEVKNDFKEALTCYSNSCYNAFGSMCRRCIQTASNLLGAKGKDKVHRQIKDLREMAEIDDETFEVLNQIIISGHDAAHPHLPKLSQERAKILLELMKDVLYQLFVRKAKVIEAMQLRKEQIKNKQSE